MEMAGTGPRSAIEGVSTVTTAHGRLMRPTTAAPHPGDLSRRIAARRAELGLSVEAVARRCGMRAGYVRHLEEHATVPTWETLRQIAAALETTPGELLGESSASCPAPGPARPPAGA